MFELVRLSVSGFRGFVGTQEFEFDRPVALLFGENHQGKSSTLNAVEWCLFGEDCVGKKTGIRERVGWEVASRSLREGNVSVVTEFQDPKGRYVVTREQHVGRRRGGEDLAILTPEGTRVHGDEAKMLLYALFRSSFQDFMTTVYQHQEAVRAVLTQEPRERNAAIDRLLGLSTYREVLDGITAANLERAVSEMEHRREDFRSRCEQTVRTLDNLIAKERGKAVSAGIGEEELSEAGALSRARHIGDAVRSLAQELGAGDFRTTVPESVGEVEAFRDWVKRQTDYLWGQAPDVVNQETLFAEQTRLLNVKQHCEGAIADETARKATRDDFVREFGDEETLVNTADELRRSAKQAEHEMRETEAKANLVWEAIQYLRGIAPTASTRRCPLCGADAPDLLSHLEAEWEETIRVRVEEVIQARDRVKARLSKVESLTAECRRLEQGLQEASGRRKIAVDQVGEALRIEIGAEDDPLALASTRLQEIDEELQLANQAIKEKRERISGIYGELSELRLIDEILSLERRKEVVERIWGTREFREMEQAIDEACELL
ncbi:MAG: AAA family ATPase, partial [bacterium]